MNDLQRKIITLAASQIGEGEHPDGSNNTKYGAAYGWNGVAWCDIFCWWVYWNCALRDPNLHEASCGVSVEKYKRAGLWRPFGSVTPEPGWQAFYDWGTDGWADHTEIVEKALGGPGSGHQAIGGNVSNRVMRVQRTRCLGYGIPPGLYGSTQEDWFDMATKQELQDVVNAAVSPLKTELAALKTEINALKADFDEVDFDRALYRGTGTNRTPTAHDAYMDTQAIRKKLGA